MKEKKSVFKRVWFWVVVIVLVLIVLFAVYFIWAVLNLEPIGGIECPSYGEILKETNIELTTEEQAKEILFDYYKEIGRTINFEVNMIYTDEELPNVKGWIPRSYGVLISTEGRIYSLQECE